MGLVPHSKLVCVFVPCTVAWFLSPSIPGRSDDGPKTAETLTSTMLFGLAPLYLAFMAVSYLRYDYAIKTALAAIK